MLAALCARVHGPIRLTGFFRHDPVDEDWRYTNRGLWGAAARRSCAAGAVTPHDFLPSGPIDRIAPKHVPLGLVFLCTAIVAEHSSTSVYRRARPSSYRSRADAMSVTPTESFRRSASGSMPPRDARCLRRAHNPVPFRTGLCLPRACRSERLRRRSSSCCFEPRPGPPVLASRAILVVARAPHKPFPPSSRRHLGPHRTTTCLRQQRERRSAVGSRGSPSVDHYVLQVAGLGRRSTWRPYHLRLSSATRVGSPARRRRFRRRPPARPRTTLTVRFAAKAGSPLSIAGLLRLPAGRQVPHTSITTLRSNARRVPRGLQPAAFTKVVVWTARPAPCLLRAGHRCGEPAQKTDSNPDATSHLLLSRRRRGRTQASPSSRSSPTDGQMHATARPRGIWRPRHNLSSLRSRGLRRDRGPAPPPDLGFVRERSSTADRGGADFRSYLVIATPRELAAWARGPPPTKEPR